MSKPKNAQGIEQVDVKVTHRRDGCPIDGKRGTHTHSQAEWRAAVDAAGETLARRR